MKRKIIDIIIIIIMIIGFWYVFRARFAFTIWYYKWKIESKMKARYIYNILKEAK